MPRPAINVAVRAAVPPANLIARNINRVEGLAVHEKERMDFVSEVDRMAEQLIIRDLKRAYPGHAFVGEENRRTRPFAPDLGHRPARRHKHFLRGFPHFCVSIAMLDAGDPIYGVIYDPLRDETFTASKGEARLPQYRRIRVTTRESVAGALLCTGFPYRQRRHLDAQLDMTKALLASAEDVRRTGSAALDLAYIACGRIDGYYETGLKVWDMAAGCLLVREAGGRYCDMAGRDGIPESGNLVAGNHKVVFDIGQTPSSGADAGAAGALNPSPASPKQGAKGKSARKPAPPTPARRSRFQSPAP